MPANGVISPLAQKVNQCSERLTKLTKNLNTVIDTTEHHNKLEQLRESLNKLMEEKLALDEAGAVKKAVTGPIINRSIETTKKELQAVTAASPYNDKKINKLASEFKAHVKIQDEINSLLEEIEIDIKANNKSKVTNFFINDFLQQVSIYNSLFQTTSDANAAKASEVSEDSMINQVSRLSKLGYGPILHPLLRTATATNLSYSYEKEPAASFRAPHRALYNGMMRWYYHPDDEHNHANTGKCFCDHYREANINIGSATQIGNVRNLLTPSALSQLKESYWRALDLHSHETEKRIYNEAWDNIKNKRPLTEEQERLFEKGSYYRGTGATLEYTTKKYDLATAKPIIKHIGHATEVIDMLIATVVVDPVNFETAKVVYERMTEAGNFAEDYFTHIVLFTHNHYDHMSEETVKKAWAGKNPLFIVPSGDAALLRSWGFKNVVEIKDWNDVVKVKIPDPLTGKINTLNVHPIPAKHASNRIKKIDMPDINTSLFAGYMLHREGSDNMTLITGDTGVMDDEHWEQLYTFCLNKNVTISTAFIAAGPDRPRKWMECTHQSTADAVTYQAKLNVLNAMVKARRRIAKETGRSIDSIKEYQITLKMEDFSDPCAAFGYHQGCFRLGILNYNDVAGTLSRMLATLKAYKQEYLPYIISELEAQFKLYDDLKDNKIPPDKMKATLSMLTNFPFADMDRFERKGIIDTLKVYEKSLSANGLKITAEDLKNYIANNTYLPKPGQTVNTNELKPKLFQELADKKSPSFGYDFQRLIVNRDPNGKGHRAYEDILNFIKNHPNLYESFKAADKDKDEITDINAIRHLLKNLFTFYVERNSAAAKTQARRTVVKQHLNKIDSIGDLQEAISYLIYLRGTARSNEKNKWETADETQRNEGHLETTLLTCYGLLTDKDFRKNFENNLSNLSKATNQLAAESESESLSASDDAITLESFSDSSSSVDYRGKGKEKAKKTHHSDSEEEVKVAHSSSGMWQKKSKPVLTSSPEPKRPTPGKKKDD